MTKKLSIEIPNGEYDHFIEFLEASPFNLQYEKLELNPICPSIIKFNNDFKSLGTDLSDLEVSIDKKIARVDMRFQQEIRKALSSETVDIRTKEQIEPAVREIVEQILYERKQFGD